MILTCPECATSYFVDDSRVTSSGRTVKCSNCGARWTALPEGVEPAPAPRPAPPPPKPAPPPPPPALDEIVFEPTTPPPIPAKAKAKPAARNDGASKALVWAGCALVIAALIAGLIVFRAQVVQMLPAAQSAYAGVGLPVSALAIEEVKAEPDFQGGHPALLVTGQLRNLRDKAANAPPLRVSLLDRLGKPVAIKVARPIDAAVPAHAVRHFAISIVDPPAATHDLEVAFDIPGKTAPSRVAAPPPPAAPAAAPPIPEAKPLPPDSPDALPARK